MATEPRQEKDKKALLETLKDIPIVQVACKRAGIGRATYYRWRSEDETFCELADEAITEGEKLINDLSESQLISLIKERKFSAIHLWLRQHHPKYGDKIEVVSKKAESENLTEEQEKMVHKALQLANLSSTKNG